MVSRIQLELVHKGMCLNPASKRCFKGGRSQVSLDQSGWPGLLSGRVEKSREWTHLGALMQWLKLKLYCDLVSDRVSSTEVELGLSTVEGLSGAIIGRVQFLGWPTPSPTLHS